MTDPAASMRGGVSPAALPSAALGGLFPAARLAPAPWLQACTGKTWQPDSPFRGAGDIFARGDEAAGAALALALAGGSPRRSARAAALPEEVSDERAFLWVQDRAAMRLGGRPYVPGLPRDLRHRCIHVGVRDAGEALFALEEGIRCRDLAFVVGEVAGNPREMDFTASRRLVLGAERHGVPLWLVRLDARRDLGAARMRWDVVSAPSAPSRWNAQAPGAARWRADLFRARGVRPGTWWIGQEEKNGGSSLTARAAAPDSGDLAGGHGDRSLAALASG